MIKLSKTLKELRIHLCPNSSNSQGLKKFIEQYYISLKSSNPDVPILVRECTGVEPRLWARYEYGQEASASLKNLNPDQISGVLKDLNRG